MKLTGWHVFAGMVGFFLIVFAMNGFMIFKALSTFDGVSQTQSYETGRAFNQQMADARARDALGWTDTVTLTPESLLVTIIGRDGLPVKGLTLSAELRRVVTDRNDRSLVFRELASGRYAAALDVPLEGRWALWFAATRPEGDIVRFRQEIPGPEIPGPEIPGPEIQGSEILRRTAD